MQEQNPLLRNAAARMKAPGLHPLGSNEFFHLAKKIGNEYNEPRGVNSMVLGFVEAVQNAGAIVSTCGSACL